MKTLRLTLLSALSLSLMMSACNAPRSQKARTQPAASTVSRPSSPQRVFVDARGVAAGGYDVISYHRGGHPQVGSARHSAGYQGATYRFASEQNQRQFESNPAAYVPAFGGYCAFGVAANGMLVPTNPQTFRIQDGRLLLFFNDEYEGKMMDTSQMWDKNEGPLLGQAVQKWPSAVPMGQ